MDYFDPNTQIAIIWDIEDVKEVRSDMNDVQAMEVLRRLKDKHDASIGINWDVIECVAEILYPRGEDN